MTHPNLFRRISSRTPLAPLALVLCLQVLTTHAQAPSPFVVAPPTSAAFADYGSGNVVAMKLRQAPATLFTFDRASLRDVLRYLADAAQIPFIGLSESDDANARLVTFTMESSPFVALESVCKDNGVRLSFENGVWFMRTVNEDRERRIREEEINMLVGIVYRLKNDPVDRVDFAAAPGAGSPAAGAGAAAQATALTTPILPLQNSQRVFQAKAPRIVNEVRAMLGLSQIAYNADGTVAGDTVTAGTNVASTSQFAATSAPSARTAESAASVAALNPTYVPPQVPQVIYNSDTNSLWVVATRAQHKWVADYLLAVDQPQPLIAIEVKFFETSRDPSKSLGLNWQNTFALDPSTRIPGGLTIAATDIRAGSPGTLGSVNVSGSRNSGIPSPAILEASSSSFSFNSPYSAVLSASQVAFTVQAFMQDQQSSVVQYPRVLTVNNREVAITSAQNTPFISGSSSVTAGSAQTSSGASFLQTGTQVNVLPKVVGDEQVALTVAITISSITGVKELNFGQGVRDAVPITSARVYNASLQVNSGYTLAVGGLEATDDLRLNNGIPFLRDIPGVGELFKSKGRSRTKRNLIVFITPSIIENPRETRGITETPEAVIPIRPNDPTPPSFSPDGNLIGGYNSVGGALAWLEFQIRLFRQINKENRTDKESIKHLRAVISTARMLVSELAAMQESSPENMKWKVSRDEERALAALTDLNQVLGQAQDNVL